MTAGWENRGATLRALHKQTQERLDRVRPRLSPTLTPGLLEHLTNDLATHRPRGAAGWCSCSPAGWTTWPCDNSSAASILGIEVP